MKIPAPPSFPVVAPERVERPVEERQVLTATNQKGSHRVIDVLAVADVHPSEGLYDVDDLAHRDIQAKRAEQATEYQQVRDK